MSSGISIDAGRGGDEGFRPWHFFVLASILLATVAVIVARRSTPEHLILMSLTIAAAGAAAAAFYRTLVPLVAPLFLPSAARVDDRTRAALEREKMLVLRSIKELEFDRAMGKLSPKDYEEMVGRLRTRAMSLIKQLDEGESGYRALIERELAARLAHKRPPSQSANTQLVAAAAEPAPQASAKEPSAAVAKSCADCGTRNDDDAAFCKRCGARL